MNRTIQIANTKTQRRYTIETSATTLGELQDQMTAQGIDFSGMTFTEGISKTQLLTRDTQLPTNVMFKGQPTNNLVMLLTNTNKQIASGAMSRKEAYTSIKNLGLQEEVKAKFGRNFTQVPTADLEQFLFDNSEEAEETVVMETTAPDIKEAPHANTVNWLYDGIKSMCKDNVLYTDDVIVLTSLLSELAARLKEVQPVVSEEDIDAMILGI